jgi:hypothetical protein
MRRGTRGRINVTVRQPKLRLSARDRDRLRLCALFRGPPVGSGDGCQGRRDEDCDVEPLKGSSIELRGAPAASRRHRCSREPASSSATNTSPRRYERRLGSTALKSSRRGRRINWASVWLAAVGFGVDVVVTVMALGSLSLDRDRNDPAAATLLIVFAFFLLLGQIITASLASDQANELAREAENKKPSTD